MGRCSAPRLVVHEIRPVEDVDRAAEGQPGEFDWSTSQTSNGSASATLADADVGAVAGVVGGVSFEQRDEGERRDGGDCVQMAHRVLLLSGRRSPQTSDGTPARRLGSG